MGMVYPGGPEEMDLSDLVQPVHEDVLDTGADANPPDTYGGRKLRCEMLLHSAHKNPDVRFPFTTLRPPGVVGPGCDDRHERLQRLVGGLPPLPPPSTARPNAKRPGTFRLAYCGDIAAVMAAVVKQGDAVHGEAFNVAGESLT